MRNTSTHLVIIPSYNTGTRLFKTLTEARARWNPVWVVIDGSTDGTGIELERWAARDPGLRVLITAAQPGQGRGNSCGLARSAGERLHPRADDGCRWAAFGGGDSAISWLPRNENPTR